MVCRRHKKKGARKKVYRKQGKRYYRAGKRLVLSLGAGVQSLWASLTGTAVAVAYGLGGMVARAHKPGGPVGEPLPSGKSALWAALMLFAFLALALFFSDF